MDRLQISPQRCPQSCRANQVPARLPDPSPTISSTASAALTLRRPKSESLLCFDSCSQPSHNEVIACCSRLMLLYIAAVDRYTKGRGFLPLLLQCRDKKPSLKEAKQPSDFRNQKAHSLTALFYSEESRNAYKSWRLTK